MHHLIKGDFSAPEKGRFALAYPRWNDFFVQALVQGACETLLSHGVPETHITTVQCPGAFELPLTVQQLAEKRCFNAIIALGAVIKGSTPHFDYVAGEAAKGISSTMLKYNVPITFGLLTVDTLEQAMERCGSKMGNKGSEAALSALEMVSLTRRISTLENAHAP